MELLFWLPVIFSAIPVVVGAVRGLHREPGLKGFFAFSVFCFSFEYFFAIRIRRKFLADIPFFSDYLLVTYCLLEFLLLTHTYRNFFSVKLQKFFIICGITYGAGLFLLVPNLNTQVSITSILVTPFNFADFFLTIFPIWSIKNPKKQLENDKGSLLVYYSFFFFYLVNLNSDLFSYLVMNINLDFKKLDNNFSLYYNYIHYFFIALGYAILKKKPIETSR